MSLEFLDSKSNLKDFSFDFETIINIPGELLNNKKINLTLDENAYTDYFFDEYKKENEKDDLVFNNTVKSRGGYIANEKWSQSLNIQSKIINITPAGIICECLIDKEKAIFETRSFPLDLFTHVNSKVGKFVLIKILTKPGSIRIDVFENQNLIDKGTLDLFSLESGWNEISNLGFEKPIQFK